METRRGVVMESDLCANPRRERATTDNPAAPQLDVSRPSMEHISGNRSSRSESIVPIHSMLTGNIGLMLAGGDHKPSIHEYSAKTVQRLGSKVPSKTVLHDSANGEVNLQARGGRKMSCEAEVNECVDVGEPEPEERTDEERLRFELLRLLGVII